MGMKASGYIAEQPVAHGITRVFSVAGKDAMHLNGVLGHQEGLREKLRGFMGILILVFIIMGSWQMQLRRSRPWMVR